ncbi:hypothetical protein AAVH_37333, partial [Aphelenchoides avenae]
MQIIEDGREVTVITLDEDEDEPSGPTCEKRSDPAWQYFTIDHVRKEYHCMLCISKKTFSYAKKPNVTTLKRHIERFHCKVVKNTLTACIPQAWVDGSRCAVTSGKCFVCQQSVLSTNEQLCLDVCASCVKQIQRKAARRKASQSFGTSFGMKHGKLCVSYDIYDSPGSPSNTMLSSVTAFRNRLPLSRVKTALRLGFIPVTSGDANDGSVLASYTAETELARQFLADIARFIWPYLGAQWNLLDVALYFFPFWQLLEMVVVCAQNRGYTSGRTYWMD